MKKLKLGAGLLAIFLSGCLVGFFVSGIHSKHSFERIFAGGPPAARDAIVKRLTSELQLTETQREHVDQVVCRTLAGLFAMRQKHQPEARALWEGGIAEMKEQLSPEQRQKLDAHFEKVRHRWFGWRDRHPARDWMSECVKK